jgi:alpha-D-ribose 1-methylphosphonate 5-triphosphate diphosphatase PhnM
MRVEHLLHPRCEVPAPDIMQVFERYADDPLVELVSVMDHTPGQRQWRDAFKYRRYAERNGSMRDEEYERRVDELRSQQLQYATAHRAAVIAGSHARGIPLASHDDTEVEHDYVPSRLLQSSLLLRDRLGWALPNAVATVSRNPAQAIALDDRGEIAPGKRADFIRVREAAGMPIVCGGWCRGARAF